MTKFFKFLIIKISMNAPFELFGCFAPDSKCYFEGPFSGGTISIQRGDMRSYIDADILANNLIKGQLSKDLKSF